MLNTLKLTGFAASLAKAIGIDAPKEANPSLAPVDAFVQANAKNGVADRVLIYNPDCIAFWLYRKYPELFIPVIMNSQMTLPMCAAFPPVTPVNFATMYTGAAPSVHGTQQYDKRLITIDSLFDALLRAGKKVAIIARTGSSMDMIFRQRKLDYFIFDTDDAVEAKAHELIEKDEYDFIAVYQMDYDDSIHVTTPEGEESMAALKRHCDTYARLSEATQKHWKIHDTLLAFAPDHGLHLTVQGVGNHFADIPEDMEMIHFWAFQPAE